jgi:hypothetical protein
MNATMIEPRCLIRVAIDSRDSFQADFAAQGNGFVGTLRFNPSAAKQCGRPRAVAGIVRHLTARKSRTHQWPS